MAHPKWLEKYLTMKPDVERLFDELEQYRQWCAFDNGNDLLEFDVRDLHGKGPHSDQWRRFEKYRAWRRRQEQREAKAR